MWRERPNSENRMYSTAGAPKLGLWRECPHSAAVMMYLWETLTVKLCCLEGLAILVSKTLVFLSRIGLVLWGWSVINPGVSSEGTSNSTILPQWYQTGPGHDLAGIALHHISFLCPSKIGERWTGGASDIVKAQSSGEDLRAAEGLVSNLPHPRVNKTKQHTHRKLILFQCHPQKFFKVTQLPTERGFCLNVTNRKVYCF